MRYKERPSPPIIGVMGGDVEEG